MRMSSRQFLDWPNKSITLLGMSGIGKTTLASCLPSSEWFHYSGDYRIGTKYLEEPILDNIKSRAMEVPFLRELLLSDSIYICSNVSIHNLSPISSFLGKLGSPALGGLDLPEFKRRQWLHRQAEIAAMRDVPQFMSKIRNIYGYQHFINDAGGSVCELDDEETLKILAENSLIIYIRASEQQAMTLIERASRHPKPLYYREAFLDEYLPLFMQEKHYADISDIPPDEFVSWVFPHLFRSRLPRYQSIADQYGYTVNANDAMQVKTQDDFINMIANVLNH